MKQVLIFLASFAATAAVGAMGLKFLTWLADQPQAVEQAASAPDNPRARPPQKPAAKPTFRTLEPGLEFAEMDLPVKSDLGDSKIRILRIDPAYFDFRLLCSANANPPTPQTARQWCKLDGLVAAINANVLVSRDKQSSVGLMQTGAFSNRNTWGQWRAYLAFDPKDKKATPITIYNMDIHKPQETADFKKAYGTLVQGARLMPKGGRNFLYRKEINQRWSAAAIGIDGSDRGRIVFLHVRSPYSMKDLADGILKLKPSLNLETLILTGSGADAQLFFQSASQGMEFVGSYKTGVRPDDTNDKPPPLHNVIGIVRKNRG